MISPASSATSPTESVSNMSSFETSTSMKAGILVGVVFTGTERRVCVSMPPFTTPMGRPFVLKGTSTVTTVSSVTR